MHEVTNGKSVLLNKALKQKRGIEVSEREDGTAESCNIQPKQFCDNWQILVCVSVKLLLYECFLMRFSCSHQ